MEKSEGKIVVLSVVFFLCFVFTATFAIGFFQKVVGAGIYQQPENLMQTFRMQAIKQLIDSKFDRFETMPFEPDNDHIHLTGPMTYPQYPDFTVNTGIAVQDDLDILLEKKIQENNRSFSYEVPKFGPENIVLSEKDITQLKTVYLFRNEQELKDLGYIVSSYRTRINNDSKESGRRDNIMISYRNIGNVRVLNPGQELSFMDEIHYDPAITWKRDTVSGLANIGGIKNVKGGGICGAAWGINAVIRPNKAFEITERFNHSRTYKNLYKNVINGKESWIPGLDIAVYSFPGSVKDFKFKNIREYPVVLVMNYDGTPEGLEELFVLSKETDRGELTYQGRKGNCFYRNANGEDFKSCYGAVLR